MIPKPSCESARLEALYRYEILDTAPDHAFDDLARLATYICHTPIAVISFVDAERQWFKSAVGLDHKEIPRETAFCSHTISGTDFFIVGKADEDERFKDHPWVIGPPAVRFYTGVPLISPDGYTIGSLAVMDVAPRTLTQEQREGLRTIANQIMAQLELRQTPQLDNQHELDRRKELVTEQKKAEEIIRESEHKFRSIFEQAPVGIATIDSLTGRFKSVNASYCKIIGYTDEEMLGRTFLDITHPDDLQVDLDQMKRLLDGEIATFELDKRLFRKNGDAIWVHLTCVPLWQRPSDPRAHLAIVQDISEHKLAEERARHFQSELEQLVESRTSDLQHTHRLLQSVIDSSPDWIFVKDREHRFVLVNKAFAASQKLIPADMAGWLDSDFWPHELCEGNPAKGIRGFHTDDRRAFAGDLIHNPYDPASLHDGTLRIFDTYKGPWRDPNGQIAGVLCYARDVTEQRRAEEIIQRMNSELTTQVDERTAELARANRLLEIDNANCKLAEEALQSSQELLRQALQASNTGLWGWNTETNEVSFSREWKRQLGYEEAEIVDVFESWETRLHPDDHAQALEYVRAYLAKPVGDYQQEFRLRHKDGTYRWIEAHASFAAESDGRQVRLLGSHTDITERHRAEEERSKQKLLISLMLSTGPGCIKRVAADGTLLHMNPAGLAMIEACREEEAIGLLVFDLVLPEHRTAFINMHQDVINGHARTLQFEIQGLQGGRRWMETYAVPFRNPSTNEIEQLAVTHDITERKQAEQALKQSEERYRALYDGAPTMYFTLAVDGTVFSVNRFGAEQLGYRADELVGQSVLGVFHEEDKEAVSTSLSECLATPEITRHWEFRKVRKDGSMMWVREVARVGQSSTGETVVLVTCEDVTERMRTEQALTFFRTLLDHIDDSIEIIDPQTGQFLDGNKGAASNIGYTRDEFLTLTVPDIDPLVTGPVFAGLMEQLRDTPNPMILDSLHRRKDGTTFPVEVSAQLIHLDKDYLVAVVRDSTERKRMEEALRSSEERFRLVTEATQDVLWDWDLSANTRWWSPNAQDKFGCDLNGVPDNKAWVSRLHPDDLDRIFAQVQDTLTSKLHMFSGEYRFRLADGSYGHFYDRAYIMRDGSGKPTRMIGAMIDITGVKQAYASLQEAYRRLQSMANELQTVESNERRRLSRELHDEVGQLLTALKFDLESVRRKSLGKKKLTTTQVAERLTRALETTDLLFTRLRQIVRTLRPQVLEELGLKAALESLAADVQARTSLSCSVVIEGDDRQPGLSPTRETALYRIAQELLTNVIRHAQAKTASISLTLGPDHWILTVEDDGIGFDPTALPLTGGVGLRGIRERVEILGGRIDLTSQRGQGTLVAVWIPVVADPPLQTARKLTRVPSARPRRAKARS